MPSFSQVLEDLLASSSGFAPAIFWNCTCAVQKSAVHEKQMNERPPGDDYSDMAPIPLNIFIKLIKWQ